MNSHRPKIQHNASPDRRAPVLLINMPFGAFDLPALSLGLLKAGLMRRGIGCDIHHFTIPFAEIITRDLYLEIIVTPPRYMIGERVFAHALFEEKTGRAHEDFSDLRDSSIGSAFSIDRVDDLLKARDSVEAYLDDCMQAVPWEQYTIIGFSSTFQQNVAALALAKRVKQNWPKKTIVFGGANCEGEMGLEIHRQFPFVDVVFRGEADDVFPLFVKSILNGEELPNLPGLVLRRDGKSVQMGDGAEPILDMDALPIPDFDDYFVQVAASTLDVSQSLRLPFESSRGCWYGVKVQCTFCGMNGKTMVYRSKSSERVEQEIHQLVERYGIRQMIATDNILNLGYFKDLIPSLGEKDPDWTIFYEVISNLTKEQLGMLKRAGIDYLQPGIESLSTKILKMTHKGCTAIQNVQLLKWASELGVDLFWNLITGLPGEDPDEYARMIELIPALVHLQPPIGFGRLRLDRFSPYFNDPQGYGITNVRAALGYRIVYPFSAESLDRLAYYFEYDYETGQELQTYSVPLEAAVNAWRKNHSPGAFISLENDGSLLIFDNRPGAVQEKYELKGYERAIYTFCDAAHSFAAIRKTLVERGYAIEEGDLRKLLEDWVAKRLMLRDGDWYLSLAVRADEMVAPVSDSHVIQKAFTGSLAQIADIYRQDRLKNPN